MSLWVVDPLIPKTSPRVKNQRTAVVHYVPKSTGQPNIDDGDEQ